MINLIPEILARRDVAIYSIVGLTLALTVATVATVNVLPKAWRGWFLVGLVAMLAAVEVAVIL